MRSVVHKNSMARVKIQLTSKGLNWAFAVVGLYMHVRSNITFENDLAFKTMK